jgi:hypothetical protein
MLDGNNYNDLRGRRFGELVVLRDVGRDRRYVRWLCECSCGSEILVRSDKLVGGRRWCCDWRVHRDKGTRAVPREHSERSNPSEYQSWRHMIARCENSNHDNFKNYGGRGIGVCERWRKSFSLFLLDMGLRPSRLHSIERDDVNGDYEPGNCRWATTREQSRNRRDTVFIEWGGDRRKLVEVCEEFGVSRSVVGSRLRIGWSVDRALTAPVRKKRSVKRYH